MPRKTPNYGQERAQRARVQESRKQEKLRQREEESLKRKAARAAEGETDPNSDKN